MRRFWTVRADYTVEADDEDQAIEKYFKNEDTTYDGFWELELAWEEDDDD
jgi:hypothetical protein